MAKKGFKDNFIIPWNKPTGRVDFPSSVYDDITHFPKNCLGFVYLIRNTITGHFYIGKKVLHFNKKRKIGKKEKALIAGKGRRPKHEAYIEESDWKTYMGSSKLLNEELKQHDKEYFHREILDFAFSKKHLSYLELKYQFKFNVLEDKNSLNENIGGKFYRKDLVIE